MKLRELLLAAMFAAVIAVMAQISIPLPFSPVPITGQTLAIALIATILPWRLATSSVGIYLLLGAVGMPVFAGATAGLGILFGPSGGYLFALIISVFIVSYSLEKIGSYKFASTFAINTAGLILVLVLGTVWMKFIADISWTESFFAGFAPFFFLEIFKAGLATWIGLTVRKRLVANKFI